MPLQEPRVDNKGQKTQSEADTLVQMYKDLAPSPDRKELLRERLAKMKSDMLVRDYTPKMKVDESEQLMLKLKTVGS